MTNAATNYLSKGGNASIQLATGVDSNGNLITVSYNLWITSFSTSVSTQFAQTQTQKQMVNVPIRRSEMLITFAIDWPLQTVGNSMYHNYDYNGFQAMQQFHNDLRSHQKLSATTVVSPPPMSFVYSNNYYPTNNGGAGRENSIVNNNLSRALDYSTLTHTNKGLDYNTSNPVQGSLSLQPISYQGWILQVSKEYDRFKAVYSNQYVMNVLTPASDTTDLPASIVVSGSLPELLPTSSTVLQQGQNWTQANISMGNGININGIPG